jgi:glycosyltransferase involved in cell wall biosynthesis
LDVYKAQIKVIEAYNLLKKKGAIDKKLVLVGPEYKPYGNKVRQLVTNLKLEKDVLIFDSVPHNELPAFYQHASINIFASETENCPFILLEALASGRPLLVSNRQPMPEFGGDAVLYFNPQSPIKLAALIIKVLKNMSLSKELSHKSIERSLIYNWEKSADLTWGSIKQLSGD